MLNDCQFNFRHKRSTEDVILSLINNSIQGLDYRMKCTSLFFDIERTFVILNHDIFFYKLRRHGIRGQSLRCLQSFLTDRVIVEWTVLWGTPSHKAVCIGAILLSFLINNNAFKRSAIFMQGTLPRSTNIYCYQAVHLPRCYLRKAEYQWLHYKGQYYRLIQIPSQATA